MTTAPKWDSRHSLWKRQKETTPLLITKMILLTLADIIMEDNGVKAVMSKKGHRNPNAQWDSKRYLQKLSKLLKKKKKGNFC